MAASLEGFAVPPGPFRPRFIATERAARLVHADLAFGAEALTIQLRGWAALAAARRRVRVPYASITEVSVGPPEWPPFAVAWRVGTHFGRVIAAGTFRYGGKKRFLLLTKRTQRALILRLANQGFDEVCVDVAEPERALADLRLHAPLAQSSS
jgi:hypothetical protein